MLILSEIGRLLLFFLEGGINVEDSMPEVIVFMVIGMTLSYGLLMVITREVRLSDGNKNFFWGFTISAGALASVILGQPIVVIPGMAVGAVIASGVIIRFEGFIHSHS